MNKLQQTAKQILEVLGTFNLDMASFTSGDGRPQNTCGTTFCLAGYLALLDEYPSIYCYGTDFGDVSDVGFDHTSYSEDKIGTHCDTVEWEFMFSSDWPNDLELTRARMEYVLQHGTVPPADEWEQYGWEQYGWDG